MTVDKPEYGLAIDTKKLDPVIRHDIAEPPDQGSSKFSSSQLGFCCHDVELSSTTRTASLRDVRSGSDAAARSSRLKSEPQRRFQLRRFRFKAQR